MTFGPPALVPELLVRDLDVSLAFYLDRCHFSIHYARMEERFAYLVKDGIHLMLDQIGVNRDWIVGELIPPFGRGINLEMSVADLDAIYANLCDTAHLFLPMEERWYRIGDIETGVRQFLCQDPDGYLLRFQQDIGTRPFRRDS